MTLPEILGRYYGAGARRVAGALVLVSEIVWFALLTEATQVVLTAAFGLAPTRAIVLSTAVFVAYTSLGGQYAVVRTDLLQYGLMVVGIPGIALACALAGADGLGGLPAEVWSFPTSPTFSAGDVFAMLVLVGLPHMVGSDVYLKLLSCRDEETARRSALLAAGSKVLFGLSVAVDRARRAQGAAADGRRAGSARRRSSASRRPRSRPSCSWPSSRRCRPRPTSCCSRRRPSRPATSLPRCAGAGRCRSAVSKLLPVLYGALGLLTALALDRDVLRTLRLGYSIFAAGLILPTLAAFLPRAGASRRAARSPR